MLNEIITMYRDLERCIQQIMTIACDSHCSVCRSPCCKIDFCVESLQSPFLEAIRNPLVPLKDWDASLGWLTSKGCRLPAGRPPVCYEFICQTIASAQPDASQCDALHQLGMLLTIAGRRAAGTRHLVEVTDLNRLNHRRLIHQLQQAKTALDCLKATAFADGHSL